NQLVGEVGGQISDKLNEMGVAGFDTKDVTNALGRIGLETAGNALIAAITGGNAGAAAASTAAGDFASIATRQWAQDIARSWTSDAGEQRTIANIISNSIASAAGAAAGVASGGGNSSLNALNGAAAASAVQQYNEAAEEDERDIIAEARDQNGKPLTDQEELQITEYYNARRELAKLDPDNAALGQSFLTEPGRTAVPTESDIETMNNALGEAQEVDRLLSTPEGQKELLEKAPVGTENLREAAQEIVENEKKNVTPLEVGTYGDQSARSKKDGLTPDHIPSFAAVRKSLELTYGRPLTIDEQKELRAVTSTIAVETKIHQESSRTYGGRNSQDQILQDAQDLSNAALKDMDALREPLTKAGYSKEDIDDAFRILHQQNINNGWYK
ncbi:hypothetical protein, partial [Acetobacter indonesiensis]